MSACTTIRTKNCSKFTSRTTGAISKNTDVASCTYRKTLYLFKSEIQCEYCKTTYISCCSNIVQMLRLDKIRLPNHTEM